jgi:hypothetical protein
MSYLCFIFYVNEADLLKRTFTTSSASPTFESSHKVTNTLHQLSFFGLAHTVDVPLSSPDEQTHSEEEELEHMY